MLDSGGLVSHRNSATQLYFPWWTRILAATATGLGTTGDGGQMDDGEQGGEREETLTILRQGQTCVAVDREQEARVLRIWNG